MDDVYRKATTGWRSRGTAPVLAAAERFAEILRTSCSRCVLMACDGIRRRTGPNFHDAASAFHGSIYQWKFDVSDAGLGSATASRGRSRLSCAIAGASSTHAVAPSGVGGSIGSMRCFACTASGWESQKASKAFFRSNDITPRSRPYRNVLSRSRCSRGGLATS